MVLMTAHARGLHPKIHKVTNFSTLLNALRDFRQNGEYLIKLGNPHELMPQSVVNTAVLNLHVLDDLASEYRVLYGITNDIKYLQFRDKTFKVKKII